MSWDGGWTPPQRCPWASRFVSLQRTHLEDTSGSLVSRVVARPSCDMGPGPMGWTGQSMACQSSWFDLSQSHIP